MVNFTSHILHYTSEQTKCATQPQSSRIKMRLGSDIGHSEFGADCLHNRIKCFHES